MQLRCDVDPIPGPPLGPGIARSTGQPTGRGPQVSPGRHHGLAAGSGVVSVTARPAAALPHGRAAGWRISPSPSSPPPAAALHLSAITALVGRVGVLIARAAGRSFRRPGLALGRGQGGPAPVFLRVFASSGPQPLRQGHPTSEAGACFGCWCPRAYRAAGPLAAARSSLWCEFEI